MSTPVAALKKSDRCDVCGAQAFVRVWFVTGQLLFCGHHYAKGERQMATCAIGVDDFRHLINERPSPSANV
jgi:hypothetical protein